VVVFSTPQDSTNYSVLTQLVNEVDLEPSLYVSIVTEKLTTGFTILFSGFIDSDNYELDWTVEQNI